MLDRVEKRELDDLADDLDDAARKVMDKVERATRESIGRIRNHAAGLVRGHPHLPHLPRSFTVDVDRSADSVEAETGGDWEKLQGRLDVFIEYGTPTSRGIAHWLPAWQLEEPRWIANLEDATEDVFE